MRVAVSVPKIYVRNYKHATASFAKAQFMKSVVLLSYKYKQFAI